MKKRKLTNREIYENFVDIMVEVEMKEYDKNPDKWFKDNNIDMKKYREWENKCLKMINDWKAK